jgi:hypothetical protein
MDSEISANRSRETRFGRDQRDCQAARGRGDESAQDGERIWGDTRRFGGRGSVSKSEPPPVSPGSGRERSIFIRQPKASALARSSGYQHDHFIYGYLV